MQSMHAKTACRWHVGSHCLDLPSLDQVKLHPLAALAAAVALLAVTSSAIAVSREWASARDNTQSVASQVELAAPRVPARPVEGLERIDLSTVVSNPSSQTLENVSLQLEVRNANGESVLSARQSRLALQPHDSRAVYWAWRVPAQLSSGSYVVDVRAFDADGVLLSGRPSTTSLQIVARAQ